MYVRLEVSNGPGRAGTRTGTTQVGPGPARPRSSSPGPDSGPPKVAHGPPESAFSNAVRFSLCHEPLHLGALGLILGSSHVVKWF